MTDRVHNFADATQMTRTEREALIRLVLHLYREFVDLYGRPPTVEEIEDHLTGKRPW